MRLAFLLMLIVSIGLAWLGFSQPRTTTERHPVVNLPRVHQLQLVSEAEDVALALPDGATVEPGLAVEPDTGHEPPGSEEVGPSASLEAFSLPSMADVLQAALGGLSGQRSVGGGVDAESGPAVCLEVAGFASRAQAEAWLAGLGSGLIDSGTVGTRRTAGRPLHWVIIPPQSGRGAALALLRDLQRAGMDSYLVTEGEQRHAISLGLFESRRAAERILRLRRQAGLDARLTEFRRDREEVVVSLLTRAPARVSAVLSKQMVASTETDGCKVLQR